MKGFKQHLTDNILSFWMQKMPDTKNGGFYGRIDGNNVLHPDANKGAVLNTRLLWTFSAAYRILKHPEYLTMAQRAFDYLVTYFIDKEHGGIYWELDCKGNPVNRRKQTYAQGFALYAFSEYYRATGEEKALELAKKFFFYVEKAKDVRNGGYFEAFTEDWQPIEDMRLSEKDANEKKSQNTHLHILEPYTNLCRIWKDERLIAAQRELIDIFTNKILNNETYHLHLFMNEYWKVKSTAISYGHDIEASWLLYEAAEVLGDKSVLEKVVPVTLKIADAASAGLLSDGSMMYESAGNHFDRDRHSWVQAEAVVGYMYAYKNSGDPSYKDKAEKTWTYILENMADDEAGEWYWSRKADGSINRTDDKAGFWKCPYHNGRMCMEMIEHFKFL
jgi:mannobiose 2-epimerase